MVRRSHGLHREVEKVLSALRILGQTRCEGGEDVIMASISIRGAAVRGRRDASAVGRMVTTRAASPV